MRLNILFSCICEDLMQGKQQVTIPPNNSVAVTEENGMKFVRFSANGMDFEGRFKDFTLWALRPDGTFVAKMERDMLVQSNPNYDL
jgi:hypothetical protein